MGRALCFVASVMAFTSTSVSAQVNSWINPGSAPWEDASNWSLGIRSASNQTVAITNQGWKAVAINPSTPVNFPGSMTVSNLTIRGAWDTENMLLLNYFGTAVPLTVLNGLTLQDGAQILNFNSGLVVQGGTIVVTNATMIQDGGFVRATNAPMNLIGSEYDLTNGVFEGGQVLLGYPVSASFNQYGGTAVISDLRFEAGSSSAGGHYALYGGALFLPNGLTLLGGNGAFSSYFQAGGTNRTTSVYMEPDLYGSTPSFTLNGGLLADNDVSIVADDFGTATLHQNGGTHVVTNTLLIAGAAANGYTVLPATYSLNNGTLSAGVIELNANLGDSVFVQSNATTSAGTVYAHSEGYYLSHNTGMTLAGGTLSCSNFTLDDGRGSFNHSGGALVVSNLLTVSGYRDSNIRYYGRYTFTGGAVTASNINIAADWVIGDGSTNRISNTGFCSLSHLLQINNAVEQLGRFILSSNATIDLAGSASRLSFANSSGQIWAGGATLVISDWNGNPAGGGAEQLKFGTSASGLTASQLAQIQIVNPSGYPSGNYSAQLLSTGELVPVVPAILGASRSGKMLTLTWGSGWTLQSATNVTGPYQDVQGATSPRTISMDKPCEFFRLRR